MTPEWIYLLKVNAGITLFYAFYKLFCQRDTFFRWHRAALLCFLAISILYPLMDIQEWVNRQPAIHELTVYYMAVILAEESIVTPTIQTPETPTLMNLCQWIYLTGIGVLLLRFMMQLASILHMRMQGTPVWIGKQRVINLPFNAAPFSFFQWIFVHLPSIDNDNRKEILTHEQTHARQWHSLDAILSEAVCIVCWFNPFAWLLKNEIRLNLEYLADEKVTNTVQDPRVYQYHLLGLANPNRQTGLYNNFNVSHLKRRIIMMNKKRTCTTGRLKYALFAPLTAALLLVSNIGCTPSSLSEDGIPATGEDITSRNADEGEYFQVCEEMPEFADGGVPGLMKFLGSNVKYPAEAQEKGIQGRVIVQFIVEKDGSLSNINVVRGIDPLLDKEAVRVIQASPKWIPGKQRGEAVRVKFTVPIVFKIPGKEAPETEGNNETATDKVDANGVHMVCEEMPEFPGGMMECMKFLSKNVKYPAEAHEKGIEGRVIVQFIVEKDGSITNAKVVRGIHPSLDAEALRITNAMPKWKPGKQKGEVVSVKFTIPISFKLQ